MALPTGHENSKVAASPNMSKLMIPSNLLPEHYQPEWDENDFADVEFGEDNNFKPTRVFNLPYLSDGEELLWSYIQTEGVFNKKAQFVMAVTNFRAGIWSFEEFDENGMIFISQIDDVLVMNSHRQSSSHRMGSFHSTGRMGMRIGTHSSMGSSRSQTIGDVHVMKDGETRIRFGNVSDPSGIVKLIKSIQKQVTVRDVVDESVTLEGVKNRTIHEIVQLFHEEKTDECIKLIDKTLEKIPSEKIFDFKAEILSNAGRWKELVVDSRKMLSRIDSEKAFEYLMTGLIKLDKTNDAIDELHRGLELFPENTMLLDFKKQLDDFEANNLLDNITCPKCKKENESDSKFCNKCGAKFDEGCEKCGKVNPKNSKFCNGCGASLG